MQPTPFSDVNDILQQLLTNIRGILGSHLVGFYLDGSLTGADFDQDSDIDFVAVTDQDVSGDLFTALRTMHQHIAASIDARWASEIEGSYISLAAIRRFDPDHILHPNIERGSDEQLKMTDHGKVWDIHRYVLRERGIVITGPPVHELIDPISADHLRRAMFPLLNGWLTELLNQPQISLSRGSQSYTVLSLCHILYTFEFGDVVSKRTAARWVQETFGERWVILIDRAWAGRHEPRLIASIDDINGMFDLIRLTLEHSRNFDHLLEETGM